jgi:membrane fusion protein, multidrug efflux system
MLEAAPPAAGRRRKAALFWFLIAAGILGASAMLWRTPTAQQAQPEQTPSPAVPVGVAPVQRKDVPVYLHGLGTVQAFYSVTVRARVDGTLMRFAVAEGQEVKQNELIAVIDPRPYQAALNAALAKKAQDQAQLGNSRRDLARYSSLAKQDFASRQQVETQQASVDQFTATIQGDEAGVETAQLNLSFCYILSPIDGRVGLRQVDPGNLIHASDPSGIVTLTQLHPISVIFTLPQATLPRISQAAKTRKLAVTALAADTRNELDTGELLTVDNAIDPSTGTIKLKATFPNSEDTLWPGQFVDARLLVGTRTHALTVPEAAIQHGPDGLFTYVLKADSTVDRRDVKVGEEDQGIAVIEQGLNDGDQVVVSGQSRLQSGTRVAVTRRGSQGDTQPDAKSGPGG